MGKIYLLNMEGTNFYKIGITGRNVGKRISELQTGCPNVILLIKEYECEYYRKVEGWLHRKYNSKRVEGEWFILNEDDIKSFETNCYDINETVKILSENNPFFK